MNIYNNLREVPNNKGSYYYFFRYMGTINVWKTRSSWNGIILEH